MLNEFSEFLKAFSHEGIPFIICIVLVYVALTYAKDYPKEREQKRQDQIRREREMVEQRENLSKVNAQQLKIITTVAEQSVEALRRSNEVIERNNLMFKDTQIAIQSMVKTMDNYADTQNSMRDDLKVTQDIVRDVLVETTKLEEIARANGTLRLLNDQRQKKDEEKP